MTQSSIALRAISEEEFLGWEPSLKVVVHASPKRFAALEFSGTRQPVALSWRSDGIDPVVAVGDRSETWLGVDQRIACVSDDGQIVLSLGMSSSVLSIRCFADKTVILCETEALLINRDYSLRMIRGFTDVPSDVFEQDGKLFVAFDDGHRESIA